ncbi:MAG TPA: hypothetical protein VGG35_20425 [Streptosporangiaceae bacterium]
MGRAYRTDSEVSHVGAFHQEACSQPFVVGATARRACARACPGRISRG